MKKLKYLNEFREKDVYSILGLFFSDSRLYFKKSVFSFLPKKFKIKEQKYLVKYMWLNDRNEIEWGEYGEFWKFKNII